MRDRLPLLRWLMAPNVSDLPSLDDLLGRPEWHQRAACRGQGTPAYVRASGGAGYGAVRLFCGGCPVRSQCLEAALADPDLQGMWGGTDDRERREMRRAAA